MSQKYPPHNLPLNKTYLSTSSSTVLTPSLSKKRQYQNQKSRKTWLGRRIRLIYLKLLRLRDKPEVVARGLAVGAFAGCFPLFGFQSLIGLLLATLVRGSKVAAYAATWISNPLTYVPLYIFNYKIGKLLLGTEDTVLPPLNLESFTAFKELGSTFALTLFTGSFVVGMIFGTIAYFYGLAIFEKLRDRKYSRRQIRRKK
ncbi:MAG: DUF2062 domain-containing protein [Cyanobacteria bacterium P01_C01_bin.72]